MLTHNSLIEKEGTQKLVGDHPGRNVIITYCSLATFKYTYISKGMWLTLTLTLKKRTCLPFILSGGGGVRVLCRIHKTSLWRQPCPLNMKTPLKNTFLWHQLPPGPGREVHSPIVCYMQDICATRRKHSDRALLKVKPRVKLKYATATQVLW